MSDMKARWFIGLMLLTILPAAANEDDFGVPHAPPLRVWSISRDSMDYVFMTSVPQADGRRILSFNHRSGRTAFIKIGEQLDGWTLTNHIRGSREEKNPRSGHVKTVDADVAILTDENGTERRLAQGQLFSIDGFRTLLVDLDSGKRRDVRGGDIVEADAKTWTVDRVSKSEVRLTHSDKSLPLISGDEVAMLRKRAEDIARAAKLRSEWARSEEQRKAAAEWEQKVMLPPKQQDAPQLTFSDIEPKYFFGSYGPVPVEYTILPPLFDNAGRMVRSAIAIPTRFETQPVSGIGNYGNSRSSRISVKVGN
jgi:hypothetical protein